MIIYKAKRQRGKEASSRTRKKILTDVLLNKKRYFLFFTPCLITWRLEK